MSRTINQARSEEATKSFFSYVADAPEQYPPPETKMTRAEWEQLSPGFRRAITRDYVRKPSPESEIDREQEYRERKKAIEYAGRKRL